MKRFRDRYADAVWGHNALRPNERLVALAFAKYAGAKDNPDDVSWVTWTTLSTMTGIRSKDALNRAVKGLLEAGWMTEIEARRQHRAPRYKLLIPTDPEVRATYHSDVPDLESRRTRNGHLDESRGTRDDSQRYASRLSEVRETDLTTKQTL